MLFVFERFQLVQTVMLDDNGIGVTDNCRNAPSIRPEIEMFDFLLRTGVFSIVRNCQSLFSALSRTVYKAIQCLYFIFNDMFTSMFRDIHNFTYAIYIDFYFIQNFILIYIYIYRGDCGLMGHGD